MRLVDGQETVILVIGSGASQVLHDRPLAERLKAEIDRRGAGHAYRRAVIVGDERFLGWGALEAGPAIAIGGPGVNALAGECAGLPTIWARDDAAWIQAAFEGMPPRVAIWGMNAAATAGAVAAFVDDGMLDEFLRHIWRFRPGALV